VSYLPNKLQTWYTDASRRPVSMASAVTSKVKGHGCKVTCSICWSISRERKVLETPKLVGRLTTPRALIRSKGRLRTSNLVGGWSIRYQLPWPSAIQCIKACEVGLLHVGGGIPCRMHPAATQLVIITHGAWSNKNYTLFIFTITCQTEFYFDISDLQIPV